MSPFRKWKIIARSFIFRKDSSIEYLWEDIGEIEPSKIDALPSSKDTFNRLFKKRLNVSTVYINNDYIVNNTDIIINFDNKNILIDNFKLPNGNNIELYYDKVTCNTESQT